RSSLSKASRASSLVPGSRMRPRFLLSVTSDARSYMNKLTLCLVALACLQMNGISSGEDKKPNPARKTGPKIPRQVLDAYAPETFHSADASLPYRIMRPKTLDPDKKYPLVLFLHGAGERGDDNEVQLVHGAEDFLKRREQFPAYVIFPQCPKEKRWVESPWDLPSGRGQFDDEPSISMRLALELVDSIVQSQPIDKSRLYVTGLSMGGQGSWVAAVLPPKRFAAMLEVCGGGDPSWASRYKGLPIWAFHGQADNVVPISRGREMIMALTEAGHHPELRFVEYPGVKHNSWSMTYARDDVYEWLFSQQRAINAKP
ncbi:MAG: alpha/beta hydrolase-fold protein, partial [Rubripirellula sp.]